MNMKTFKLCRMKPKSKCCGKYLHLEKCTKEEMEIIEHYSDKQTLKKLVIVHVFLETMTELCIHGSIWWEEFKWAWVLFLTYLKCLSNSLRRDIFPIEWNIAYFSKVTPGHGISINWHLVSYQWLALKGFVATSSLTSSCDTRLYSQTFPALKTMKNGKAEVLFDFSGLTFWCEICCCKTSQSFRVRMDSWIKWLSLLSALKIDIAIMAETTTTDKLNRASLFFHLCKGVQARKLCLHTKSLTSSLKENYSFSPCKVFSEDSQIYLGLSEIFGSFLRLLLAVEMRVLEWTTGVAP